MNENFENKKNQRQVTGIRIGAEKFLRTCLCIKLFFRHCKINVGVKYALRDAFV